MKPIVANTAKIAMTTISSANVNQKPAEVEIAFRPALTLLEIVRIWQNDGQ